MVEEHQTVVGTCLLLMGTTPACRHTPSKGASVVMPEHKSCPAAPTKPISRPSSALRPARVNVANTAGSERVDIWWQIVLRLIRQIAVMLKNLTGFGWKIPKKTRTKRLSCTSQFILSIQSSHNDINIPIPWMSWDPSSSSLYYWRNLKDKRGSVRECGLCSKISSNIL